MSYNVRVSNASDGENDWLLRRNASIEMLRDIKPDICGFQEVLEDQLPFLRENSRGYTMVGDSPNPIIYNSKRFSLVSSGFFFLSETPETPSKGWDGAYPRTAYWGLMKDNKAGKCFYFVNTHLDHIGKIAREKGLALILERISSINSENLPLVITGDFNTLVSDPALNNFKLQMKNSRDNARISSEEGSFNAWGREDSCIDFIWYDGFSLCKSFEVIKKEYGRKYISDHYPILSVLKY